MLVDSCDGVSVALHDLSGTGRPLLFVHATGFCGPVWQPLARRLSHRYHGWAPDLRGHGDAATPAGLDFNWSGFADDVLAVVDHLAPAEPLLAVGHSKGAAALLLAEQRRPSTFQALYCYEPVVMPPDFARAVGEENPLAEGARRRRDRFPSSDEAYANFAGKPPFDRLREDALRAYIDGGFREEPDGSVVLKCRPEHEAQMYRMGGSHDAFSHLGEIGCPVTIARGGTSDHPPGAVAPTLAEALPQGTLVTFDDLGHFGPLEDPDAVADDVARAFAEA